MALGAAAAMVDDTERDNNNKNEHDAGMVTPRQPKGLKRRPWSLCPRDKNEWLDTVSTGTKHARISTANETFDGFWGPMQPNRLGGSLVSSNLGKQRTGHDGQRAPDLCSCDSCER